ncbi:MAG: transposase [candidate division Zixibacteria bacterium]|nr:transposase [candidate division Zixibacteria bacterium]
MTHNLEKHHRRSIRLKEYDYSQAGGYFVTICTDGGEFLFGDVVNEEMELNERGIIVKREWLKTAELRKDIILDEYIIMPNHFHGVILIIDDGRGTARRAPTVERFSRPVANSFPTIVRSFKSAVTNRINQIRGTPGASVWQRNYYEHVIRNEDKLFKIRQYIQNNPLKWHLDRENPERVGLDKLEGEIFNLGKNTNYFFADKK